MNEQHRNAWKALLGVTAFLTLTLLLHGTGAGSFPLLAPLAFPGSLLYRMFLGAAWLLPLYTGLMAGLLMVPWSGWIHLAFTQLLWLPIFTLALLARLAGNETGSLLSDLLGASLGRGGSVFLLMFFTVLEVLVIGGAVYLNRTRLFPWLMSEEEIREAVNGDQISTEGDLEDWESLEGEELPELAEEKEPTVSIRQDPFFREEAELQEVQDPAVISWDALKRRQKAALKVVAPEEVDPAEEELGRIFDADTTEAPADTEHHRVKVLVNPKGTVLHKRFPSYSLPTEKVLRRYVAPKTAQNDEAIEHSSNVLEKTLKEFNIEAKVTGIKKGPVVTMFEILPAPGVKLSRIVALADNIALVLAAGSVRIVAPIPGKHAVGIEVPNPSRTIVGFEEAVTSHEFQESTHELPIALGKDISGDLQVIDLAKTPHLLIAGATGSGKSVMVNALICSILYKRSPDEVRLLMVDPKIVELKFFNDIPHLLTPVITEPKKALMAAQWCLAEMERRYSLLDAMGVRDIKSFNAKIERKKMTTGKLPYIVFVVDEFADLMATSGKELENIIARLAAMSRAVGIHLVLATQRPSIDVITGLIKANFPSRIAFMVASKTDSRIILDATGAENLLGRGDMLFTSAWDPFPRRIQGAFLSEEEVEKIVDSLKALGEPEYITDEIFIEEDLDTEGDYDSMEDPLWSKAVEIVTTTRKASASYLQRRMSIGYNRAARLIEEMERQGIVGPQNGSKPREIISGLAG